MRWMRKAAENGHASACVTFVGRMYSDQPYARQVGRVEQAVGVTTSVGVTEGHDVPPDILTSLVYWLRNGGHDPVHKLGVFRIRALEGHNYCFNEGCEVVGHLKEFKVCPQC